MAADANQNYSLTGCITNRQGEPLSGLTVRAFDMDLRSEQALGETKTDRQGFYRIQYSKSQFSKAEKDGADLVVKAFADDGSLLAASPVLFHAPLEAEVNLTVADGALASLTLFEKIGRDISPLPEGLRIEELEEDERHQDLSFLSGKTGFEKNVLARFIMAHKLAEQTLQAEFWFALLGGSFYVYADSQNLAEQLEKVLKSLSSLDTNTVRKSLVRSFKRKEIPQIFQERIEQWIEEFFKFAAGRTVSDSARPTFVKSVLEDAGIKDAGKRERFARLFNEHKALTPELIERLSKDDSFEKSEVDDLHTSFRLSKLTQGDFSVVKAIKEEFGVREPAQIRQLAKRSESEWVDLVRAKHAAGEIKLPFKETPEIPGTAKLPEAEIYGKMLERQFREAFPTAAFAGGLERALQNGGSHGLRHAEAFGKFLERHENFELLDTSVEEFLKDDVHDDFSELAKDESFKLEVKAVQRVFKLAPTFEATDAMLADNLHSAQQVYRMGESEFVRRYADRPGFTAETARLAWNRAADTHAAVLTIIADLKALEGEALPFAIGHDSLALSTFPNWNNLFKSGDLCECEHCNSVLGPAAYFADLLMFLKDRKAENPAQTVKDVLFSRRPDLGFLELDCQNALTPLPYIDVVCEVLEDAIDESDENDLELVGFTTIPTDPNAAKDAVAAAFEEAFKSSVNDGKEKIKPGADFSLSQVSSSAPDQWVLHGQDATYLLKKGPSSPDFFAKILRNTKTAAAELRAYPQYVNPKAHEKLRAAKYPLTLPFDLFAEEVRAALNKINLKRWDLMQTMRGTVAPNDPADGDVAVEYFGINSNPAAPSDEKRLILETDPTINGQQEVWGATGANWLETVSNVKNFLQKTSLEYNELLALIDLKFINPDGDIVIQHLDASCDTNQKVIQALDPSKLDRIHRFLRLWRKLEGWKMWELDLVIRHPRIGATMNLDGSLDKTFLINLFYFSQIRKRLGKKATVEQISALFGRLNTESRFTKPHEKREDALYQHLFLNRKLISPLDPAFQLDPSTGDLPAGATITAHQTVIMAALGIREADLILLKELTRASDPNAFYITDDLTLENLSFLWRHAWLAKLLKIKVEEWKVLLKIFDQDILHFADPKEAFGFLENVDYLKNTGFKLDELNWVLAADLTAKAAVKEADAARFLTALRKQLQAIQIEHDSAQYDFLTEVPPTNVDSLTELLTSLLQKLNWGEAEIGIFLLTLRGSVQSETSVQGLPAGFTFPAAITGAPHNIPIQYDEPNQALRFTGLMTDAQRATLLDDVSLSAVTDKPSYQNAIGDLFQQSQTAASEYVTTKTTSAVGATLPSDRPSIPIRFDATTQTLSFIGLMTAAEQAALKTSNPAATDALDELFLRPRLAVKFYEPVFTAPLANLPAAVDFKTLPDALALKLTYDAEQRLLQFKGILSKDEKAALDALSSDPDYRDAVNSLATQPQTIVPPDERIWLTDTDLDAAQPNNDTLAKRLANGATKALAYLSQTLSQNVVVQQSAAQLGLTEALTLRLLTRYEVVSETLLEHLTSTFAATTGVVDHATLTPTFDGWYWASRVAAIWKKWKITLPEWEKIFALTAGAQLLDFKSLPLNETQNIASFDRFLRTSRLLRLRDSLPETKITLLEVLEKLSHDAYADAAAFAVDVESLNEAWIEADVKALVSSLGLDLPDFLLAESWERLRRAFYFLDNLNAGAEMVKTFADTAMNDSHARTLKELLRSKLGAETWLTLSAELQDVLRERKRDALTAYLLTQPEPAEPPSGKWENTNDLFAYYLLDVEMSACQLTSRLVQASGSVQLFVQRCFLGLEPVVVVKADGDDGDSAWRWWRWMRKYRVWEANRKVFLWPENWIEPELKKDRSQFFKDLESELLQNEVNQHTVETAFQNYLEKLDGVAQLEIVGFYQEDDGDNAIIHVFGSTAGVAPQTYYYRRYDYRQWTPWEKVELDIEGDYLIPAVINKRLFLFWPAFTEIQDPGANDTIPIPNLGEPSFAVAKIKKRLKLEMAMSEYRLGKWMPKKVSKDYNESESYVDEVIRKHYSFYALDKSEVNGRFSIMYYGYSGVRDGGVLKAHLSGIFDILAGRGMPEHHELLASERFIHATRPEIAAVGNLPEFRKWVEIGVSEHVFTLVNYNTEGAYSFPLVLTLTPGVFKMLPPWHLSYMDKLLVDGLELDHQAIEGIPAGSWLPFFYNDSKRTFFVLPILRDNEVDGGYLEVKRFYRQLEEQYRQEYQTEIDNYDLSTLTTEQRQQLELDLWLTFPEEAPPEYTDAQVKRLMMRRAMRSIHLYLGFSSLDRHDFRVLHFKNYYHPFVADFAKLVNNPLQGIPALMSRAIQLKNSGFSFRQSYRPSTLVIEAGSEDFYPHEIVDFSPDGAYSPYNWELFFHAPLLIANSLSKNQRFEEARDWYHFIFNPLGVESPMPGGSVVSKYWITKPFFETTDPQYLQQRIDNILRMLAGDTSVPGYSAEAKKALEDQVFDWRTNPFEPHRIANYRTVAYQKTVVMKYLDNLIAWGDNLFRQDSMESINEATQLYILAAEILGPRPKKVPPQAKPQPDSFNELENKLDKFSNALIEVENLVPAPPDDAADNTDSAPLPMLYFCIPQNDKMLGYWETVADRLYKIRHCMNIEGVVRQLALFEPPIDPGALVKAVAGGVDISSALGDLNAPLPLYRFNVLLQKANEMCNEVRTLGSALLSALEKKDTEALGLLRQSQEIILLESVKAVREQQIEEAKRNLEGVKKNKELITKRRDYYRDIEKINAGERLNQEKLGRALLEQQFAQVANIAASIFHIMPSFDIGANGLGSPKATVMFGGPNFGSKMQAWAGYFNFRANEASYEANKAATDAAHVRRAEEWKFQENLADKELEQIDESIAVAELRIAIAEKELENHVLQIENAKATDAFMRSKYTNEELYQWQIGQISDVYFQSYKLAYDLAKRAERCFRFELGLQESSYIKFGYWDSLKKGLLAGEKLQYDLHRLETAYLEQNRREFELIKHISVAMLDPLALVKLRETGRCFLRLPEEIFDLDYPGHYFRRIKSVSLTMPCVVGPYTTISCTLRLLKNSTRIKTRTDDGYPRNTDGEGLPADDDRFVENNIPVKAITASNAQNDSGVFELNFRDERYLPFEGAGVISEWSLELFSDPSDPGFGKDLRQFDYNSISDVIVHVKYTAREDAGAFKNHAVENLRTYFREDGALPSLRMFNLRQEFPNQWHRFLFPANTADGNIFELEVTSDLFPFRDMGKTLKINKLWLLARCADKVGSYSVVLTPPLPAPPPAGSNTMTLTPLSQFGDLHFSQKEVAGVEVVPTEPPITWQLKMSRPGGGNLQEDPVRKIMEVEDVLLVLGYEWE